MLVPSKEHGRVLEALKNANKRIDRQDEEIASLEREINYLKKTLQRYDRGRVS